MNIFQLTCFLTVAETLNFARAAERLCVTQPAVTHQIHALEAELNAILFIRTTHSVQLTRAGMLFIDDARSMVTTSMRAKKRLETMHEQDFPMLNIGIHSDGYFQILPEVLREFSALYPNIHPNILMVSSQQLLYRLLEDEKADIVFGIKDLGGKAFPGIYKELGKSPLMCVCASNHFLAKYSSVAREDLDKIPLILFDTTKPSFYTSKFQGEMIGGRNPSDLYFCESTTTAMILAKAGYGVFFLPELFAPADGFLTAIPIEDTEAISFGMYYHTLKDNLPLKSFVRIIKQNFSQPTP